MKRKMLKTFWVVVIAAMMLPCIVSAQSITDDASYWYLTNSYMQVRIDKTYGYIVAIDLSFMGGRGNLITASSGPRIEDYDASPSYTMASAVIAASNVISTGGADTLQIWKNYASYPTRIDYTIYDRALQITASCSYTSATAREIRIFFDFAGIVANMDYANWSGCDQYAPKSLLPSTLNTNQAWKDGPIPFLTLFSKSNNDGLSFVAPFEIKKPETIFYTDANNLNVQNYYLRSSTTTTAKASIYIVPHEGDWRPGLGWMYEKYPTYFSPSLSSVRQNEGFYCGVGTYSSKNTLQDYYNRGARQAQIHNYFPFYGYYAPSEGLGASETVPNLIYANTVDQNPWDILLDNDAYTIAQWESNQPGGLPVSDTQYDTLFALINDIKSVGMFPYIYSQSLDCWDGFADLHFNSCKAKNSGGTDQSGWLYCTAMNADTATGESWGYHVMQQTKKLATRYWNMTGGGLFWDRNDGNGDGWRDYGHNDGVSMITATAFYKLPFSQVAINLPVTAEVHSRNLAICSNNPSSIESCKDIDIIMNEYWYSEQKSQYLGLNRQMVLLMSDFTPSLTEKKLKSSLFRGYMPCLASGTDTGCLDIERKYRPVIDLLKGKSWVFNANALTVPSGLWSNVFTNANGESIVTVLHPNKSQLDPNPIFTYNIPVTLAGADVANLKYAYLLSGDYEDTNSLNFTVSGSNIQFTIPAQLASSVICFTKTKKYELTRISSPVITRGKLNSLIFNIDNLSAVVSKSYIAEITTPWGGSGEYSFILAPGGSRVITMNQAVPLDASKTEVDINVKVNGVTSKFTAWVVDGEFQGGENIGTIEKQYFYDTFNIWNESNWSVPDPGYFTSGSTVTVSGGYIYVSPKDSDQKEGIHTYKHFSPSVQLTAHILFDGNSGDDYNYFGFSQAVGDAADVNDFIKVEWRGGTTAQNQFLGRCVRDAYETNQNMGSGAIGNGVSPNMTVVIRWRPDRVEVNLSGAMTYNWTVTDTRYIPQLNLPVILFATGANGHVTTIRADDVLVEEWNYKNKIHIYTPARVIASNNPTAADSIGIEVLNTSYVRDTTFSGSLEISSSSSSGMFSGSLSGPWYPSPCVINLTSGETRVYYKDIISGSVTLSVYHVTSTTIMDTWQAQSITAGSYSATASYLVALNSNIRNDGVDPCTVVVHVTDNVRAPMAGKYVTVTTSNTPGMDTITYPFGRYTDAYGICYAKLVTTAPIGKDTIVAAVDSETITNMYFGDNDNAAWLFDEGGGYFAYDVGGMHPGNVPGDQTWNLGKYGSCPHFDGVNDYVQISDNLGINTATSFTFEAWVYLGDTVTIQNLYIMSKPLRAAIGGFSGGTPNFGMVWFYSDETAGSYGSGLDIRGAWHHVAQVFDSSLNKMYLYLDGAELSGGQDVTKALGTGGDYLIGTWTVGYGHIHGDIDDVRIYNRALSSGEVLAFAQQKGRPINITSSYRMRVITPVRNVTAGTVTLSNSISVAVYTETNALATWYNTPFLFVSSSPTGQFSATGTGTWLNSITLNVISGETRVYYRDTKSGSPTIRISSGSLPIWVSQIVSVAPNKPSNTSSYILCSNAIRPASGVSPCTLTAFVKDCYGNPLNGRYVDFRTTHTPGYDTITYVSGTQYTDTNGMIIATLVSTLATPDTVKLVVSGYASNTITNNERLDILGGAWKFDEGAGYCATDFSGNGNYGIIEDGITYETDSRGGYSLHFAEWDHVNIPYSSSLNVGSDNNSFTLEFWYKPTDSNINSHIFTKGGGTAYPFSMVRWTNNINFWTYDGSTVSGVAGAITVGAWNHVVAVRNRTTDQVQIYVNGAGPTNAADNNVGPLNNTDDIRIGYVMGAAFSGYIDEVRIYNCGLNASDAKARYLGTGIPIIFTSSASKFKIISPARATLAGQASNSIAIEAQDNLGVRHTTTFTTVRVTSLSPTCKFADTQTATVWYTQYDASVNAGLGSVYFQDIRTNSPAIIVTDLSNGLPGDSQTESVSVGAFSGTASYIVENLSALPADGASLTTATIFITDMCRNVLSGRTVTLKTTNSTGYDTIGYSPTGVQTTNASGYCTAGFRSSIGGPNTVTAVVSGASGTVTYTHFKDIEIAAWNFDECTGTATVNLLDKTNTGTFMNAPAWEWGKYGGCPSFDGIDKDWVEIYHPSVMDNIGVQTQSYSVEFWLKSSAPPASELFFLAKIASSNYSFNFDQYPSGFIDFRIWDGTYCPSAVSIINVTDGQWHHIAGVRDSVNRTVRLYVDGSYTEGSDNTLGNMSNTASITVGSSPWNSNCFNGLIDELRIYSRALTQEEVTSRYLNRSLPVAFTATRFDFTTFPSSAMQGVSTMMVADALGNAGGRDLTYDDTGFLTSSSASGRFSVNQSSWYDSMSVTFSQGQSTFYFRDASLGTYTISVARAGLPTETGIITIQTSPPPYPGKSVKTLEYVLDQAKIVRSANTGYYTPTFYIYIPESGITLRSAWVDITFQCTSAAVGAGSQIGVNGANTQTFAALITPSSEDVNYCLRYNATNVFSALAGSGTNNGPYALCVKITQPRSNESVKLYITYEYDESAHQQMKTVRFFAGSRNTALASGDTCTFSHTPYISEPGYIIKDLWYEIRGQYQADAFNNNLCGTMTLNLGSVDGNAILVHGASISTNEFLYFYKPSTNPVINTLNSLGINILGNSAYCLSAELVITYSFDYLTSTTLLQTIRRYMGQTDLSPAIAEPTAAVYQQSIYFPEKTSNPVIRSIYALTRTTNSADAINLDIGQNGLDTVTYAMIGITNSEGSSILTDLTSQYGSISDAANVVISSKWSVAAGGSRSTELVYTYEYPKNPTSAQKTVMFGASAGDTIQDTIAIANTTPLKTVVYLPDTNLSSIINACILAKMTTSTGGRFKIGVDPQSSDFITVDTDDIPVYAERLKEASASITGAGSYAIKSNVTSSADVSQLHITGVSSYVTYRINAGDVTNLDITSDSRTVNETVPSRYIYLAVRNNYGWVVTSFNNTVTLSSSSTTGKFSAVDNPWSDTTCAFLSSGEGWFYYRDTAKGNFVITVSRSGLRSDTQYITVRASNANWVSSYIQAETVSPLSNNSPSNVYIYIRDTDGLPVWGRQLVTVYTSRGPSYDTVTLLTSVSDIYGKCTATISSKTSGADTITAFCDGQTIYENRLYNPGFELDSQWWSKSDQYCKIDTQTGHTGRPSGKIENTQNIGVSYMWQSVSVDPGANYVFSGWIKTGYMSGGSPAASANFFIHHQDAGWAIINQDWTSGITASYQDWTQCFIYLQAESPDCVYFSIGCAIMQQGSVPGSSAWFDDVRLYRVPTVDFLGASKLGFTSPSRVFVAGTVPDSITIQAQWPSGQKADEYNGPCNISTSSHLGYFSAGGATWTRGSLSLNIVNGETSVYYKDYDSGSPTLTVTGGLLTNTYQLQSVSVSTFSATQSYIKVSPSVIPATGINTCYICVTVTDKYGNPLSNQAVQITTSRKGTAQSGYDTIVQPATTTDSNGQATGTLVSSLLGEDTIIAKATGFSDTISMIYFGLAPVAAWNLDENAGDTFMANTYDWGVKGSGCAWDAGKFGSALTYSGDTQSIVLHSPNIDVGKENQSYSFAFWYKSSAAPDGTDAHFFAKWGATWPFSILKQGWGTGKVEFRNYDSVHVSSAAITIDTTDGYWHHIVFIRDCTNPSSKKVFAYLDGAYNTSSSDPTVGDLSNQSNLAIGGKLGGTLNGSLDEIRIFNGVLPVDAIERYATGRSVRFVAAEKIAIITPARTTIAGVSTDSICIQAQWNNGSKASGCTEVVTITSGSGTGRFADTKTASTWSATFYARLVSGETYVFFKDTTAGSPTINAVVTSLPDTSQIASVGPAALSNTLSYITTKYYSRPADGGSANEVTVVARDIYANTICGYLVTVAQSGPAGTITYPSGQYTNASGKCVASIVSTNTGVDTVTATVGGATVTQIAYTGRETAVLNFDIGSGLIADDYSGWGDTGILTGSLVWNSSGKYGSCLDFSGDDSIILGTGPAILGLVPFTLEMWVKTTTSGLEAVLITQRSGGSGYDGAYQLKTDTTGHPSFFSWGSGGTGFDFTATGTINNGQWRHVVAVRETDGTGRIYIDGSLDNSGFTQMASLNSINVLIGANEREGGMRFVGSMDEVRIYNNYAMTGAEVATRYIRSMQRRIYWAQSHRLVFSTPVRTVAAGSASNSIAVQVYTNTGALWTTYNQPCVFTSSTNGLFSYDGSTNWATSYTANSFVNGETRVYYKDTKTGSPTIYAVSGGASNQQVQSIQPSTFNNTASFLRIVNAKSIPANGTYPCTIAITVNDQYQNPVLGATVNLYTTNPSTGDTKTYPYGQTTNANGVCTVTLVSMIAGPDTITAVVTGYPNNTVTYVHFSNLAIVDFEESMGNSIYDVSPYKNNGTNYNATWIQGRIGRGINLQGSPDYLTFNSTDILSSLLGKSGQSFSVEFWFYTSAAPGADCFFFTKNQNWVNYAFSFVQYNGTGVMHMRLWDGTSAFGTANSGALNDGQWHHMVGVKDESTQQALLYVDNAVPLTGSTVGLGNCTTTDPIIIGNMVAEWSGVMDGMRIYDYALSSADVSQRYYRNAFTVDFTSVDTAVDFAFTSPQFSIKAGSVSLQITAIGRSAAGNTATALNDFVNLTSSTAYGKFSVTDSPWANTTTIYFTAGVGRFYYKDTEVGVPQLQVSKLGVTSGYQKDTVTPYALNFVTNPFVLSLSDSVMIKICAQNADASTATNWADTVVLQTSSVGGFFSVSSSPWADTTTVYLSSGQTTFYYKDSQAGNPMLTISRADLAILDTQSDTVAASTATKLVFTSAPFRIRAGTASSTITVVAQNAIGNTDVSFNGLVDLLTDSNSGSFSVNDSAWSDTTKIYFSAGVGRFFYKDMRVGVSGLNADYSGLTIGVQSDTFTPADISFSLDSTISVINVPTTQIAVTARDGLGNTAATWSDTILFTSSSLTGEFSVDGSAWSGNETSIITFSLGVARFYYRDSTAGTYTITASRFAYGLSDTMQIIAAPVPPEASKGISYLSVNTRQPYSDGSSQLIVSIILKDSQANPIQLKQVTIVSSRGSQDTITQPSITDVNGQCTGYITSAYIGQDTITAYADANTTIFENIVFNGSFEDGINTDAYYWTESNVYIGRSGLDLVKSGSYSCSATFSASGRLAYAWQDVPVEQNSDYILSGWMYLTAAITGVDVLKIVGTNTTSLSNNQTSYTYYEGVWNSGSDLAARLYCYGYRSGGLTSPRLHWDDISLRKVPTVSWSGNVIRIVTNAFTAGTGSASSYIKVAVQDAVDNTDTNFSGTITLITSSAQGVFSLSDVSWINTTNITLSAGVGIFYYKDDQAGMPWITVMRSGFVSGSQQETITTSSGATYLEFASVSFDTIAGQISPLIKIVAKTAGGNTDTTFNNTVSLSSSSGTYSFSVSSTTWANTSSINLSSGIGYFYYTDTQAGQPVITAYRVSLSADTQAQIIRPASLKFTSQVFTISSISTATIVARYRNADGNTATNWMADTAVVITSSAKGRFSISYTPWSDTTILQFSSGAATFYYMDRLGGNPIITVYRIDYSYTDTQSDTITRPVVSGSKIQYNMRSGETGSYPMKFWPSDTIEYTIYITNTGTETATGNIIVDTRAFDTYTNNAVGYIWMETSTIASTWSYATDTPALNWITGSPYYTNPYVKGLRWKIDALGINQTKAIRFRVRVR